VSEDLQKHLRDLRPLGGDHTTDLLPQEFFDVELDVLALLRLRISSRQIQSDEGSRGDLVRHAAIQPVIDSK